MKLSAASLSKKRIKVINTGMEVKCTLRTSWATNPPITAAIGQTYPREIWENVLIRSSPSSAGVFRELLISWAILKNSDASWSFFGRGYRLNLELNSSKAENATCNCSGLSNFPKSYGKISGSGNDSLQDF